MPFVQNPCFYNTFGEPFGEFWVAIAILKMAPIESIYYSPQRYIDSGKVVVLVDNCPQPRI